LIRGGLRDRLGFAVVGWTVAYIVFTAFAILAPVEPRFWRYSVEFLDRVNYAVCPVDVILAARAAAWGWRRRGFARVGVTTLLAAAFVVGVQRWAAWFAA
jgi:hypothetical protein